MYAVIMAGGKGTRIKSLSSDIPKPMVLIKDKPVLQYQIENLYDNGITNIIIVIGHLGHVIKNFFKDGSDFNVSISYIEETSPLGTAGSLYYLKNIIKDDFILLFGDLLLDINWKLFIKFHKNSNALITLFAHPNMHPYDSDLLIIKDDGEVSGIDEKGNLRKYYYHNIVNAGIYVISPGVVQSIQNPQKLDLEKDIITPLIAQKKVYAYRSPEFIKDIGTPERIFSVLSDVEADIVHTKNLKNKQKAIFLDRDGTINQSHGFINTPEKFQLIEQVSKAIQLINQSQYLCIVITNQPVIARGECTFEQLEEIHKKMETQLGEEGCYIDGLFYCPHHPDSGFSGEIKSLKIVCECRKPNIGMLKQAETQFNLDLSSSWIIGDTTTDIKTGINGHLNTALVLTGEKGQDKKYDVTPQIIGDDLLSVVKKIIEGGTVVNEKLSM